MKLSRRGKHTKHARRGRHTKRAGKHLRYKTKSKKFRASKRYHRGNKRTYKRGKRFQIGGASITLYNVKFLVSKKGPYLEQPQTFDIDIELNDNNVATVKLVRTDNQNITFTIKGSRSSVLKLLHSPQPPLQLIDKTVDLQNLEDNNRTGTYDFYRDAKNKDSFTIIITKLGECIKNYDYNPPRLAVYTQYGLFQSAGIGLKTSRGDLAYQNYVGRFTLQMTVSEPQLYDVYYSGELKNGDYRNGFIHLFPVGSYYTESNGKRIYNLEYTVSTTMYMEGNLNFTKIEYDNTGKKKYTGGFTLTRTPDAEQIGVRVSYDISNRPNGQFDWQEETKNNDEQQTGWKPKVVDESLFV